MKKKLLKSGYTNVFMHELDGEVFTDINFFEKYIREDCEVVNGRFYHEFGQWDGDDDVSYISIEWKVKE